MADGFFLQLSFGSERRLRGDGLLEIGIEAFVRIELRAVRQQVKYLGPVAILVQPFPHDLGVMRAQVVENQENLAVSVLDPSLEEVDQNLGIERTVETHPAPLAPVGGSRGQRDVLAFVANANYRRLALTGLTASANVVGTKPGFVAPVNLGAFTRGLVCDRRKFLGQPSDRALAQFGLRRDIVQFHSAQPQLHGSPPPLVERLNSQRSRVCSIHLHPTHQGRKNFNNLRRCQ